MGLVLSLAYEIRYCGIGWLLVAAAAPGRIARSGPGREGEGTGVVFPSIENKYGRPIEEWLELILQSPRERQMGS